MTRGHRSILHAATRFGCCLILGDLPGQDDMMATSSRNISHLLTLKIVDISMVPDFRTRTDLELADFLQKALGLALLCSTSTRPWHLCL